MADVIPMEPFPLREGPEFNLVSLESLKMDNDVHSHDFYAIIWFREGHGTHYIDFDAYEVGPNRFHFFAPGKAHTMDLLKPPRGAAISFTENFLLGSESPNPLWYEYPFFSFYRRAEFIPHAADVTFFENMVREMETETAGPHEDRFVALQQHLRLLLIHILRRYGTGGKSTAPGKDLSYFRRFILLVSENFLEQRDLGYYARRLGISVAHLTACTRAVSGRPASRLLQERILLEVKRLLRHSELPVYKIADDTGFQDAAYLTRFFKKMTGRTPSEFRAG